MQRPSAHLYFEIATDFVFYYSCVFHSPACLQSWQDTSQISHQREQTRRCGVAAQRWRARISALLLGSAMNVFPTNTEKQSILRTL
jgi:hypothetical protein